MPFPRPIHNPMRGDPPSPDKPAPLYDPPAKPAEPPATDPPPSS